MFSYKKFLQYPIKLKNKNPQLASLIATQYGGAYCKCLSGPANAAKTRI